MDGALMSDPLDRAQHQASDPQTSVWVSASAGTGKTKVLVDRLLRLLLQGVSPSQIVCLTFTQAAASEMQERLHHTLMVWASHDGATLEKSLMNILGRSPAEAEGARARQLLNQLLRTELRIQTLHSFCQSLLQMFPLEAGLQPDFTLLNEHEIQDLLQDALIQAVSGNLEPDISKALHEVRERMEAQRFQRLIRDLASQRWVLGFLGARSYAHHQEALDSFGEEPSEMFPDLEGLRTLSHLLAQGSPAEQAKSATLTRWLDQGMPDVDPAYHALFLKAQGASLKAFRPTQKLAPYAAQVQDIWHQEALRLLAQNQRTRLCQTRQCSAALAFLTQHVIHRYERLKSQRYVLDYDDLIVYALGLLGKASETPWVLAFIENNLQHLLLDEAQDTSPPQWKVIHALVHEMFQSDPAQGSRTLFVVGDFKQSIYSFQGADPYYFQDMHTRLRQMAQAYNQPWRDVTLGRSYRSCAPILTWVEQAFQTHEAHPTDPISPTPLWIDPLEPVRDLAPGHVEVWPLVSPPLQESDLKQNGHEQPSSFHLAQDIARRVHQWLSQPRILPARQRPLEPRDVMILLQRRGEMMEALVHSLARRGIPTSGMDRFSFKENLAVQDLMMIARVALNPHDDLALACVLKGPWIGWQDEDLWPVCISRPSRTSVWSQIKKHEALDHSVRQQIQTWRSWAGSLPPFEFFSQLLEHQRGRETLVQRLGMQTHEILDTFLQACLDFERAHPPTLQHWVDFWESHEGTMKRDPHHRLNQVRIMSVHSAKGLQAPVVILADAHGEPRLQENIFLEGDEPPYRLIWSPRQDQDVPEAAALRNRHKRRQLEESQRLLYVASTRAEDELYVAGWGQDASLLSPYTWYRQAAETQARFLSLKQRHDACT